MKHAAELYQQLIDEGKVRAIRRYNLRKFCRSFELPPCGVAFWRLDDVNWDHLQSLDSRMRNDKFRFRGGEQFPRGYWDDIVLGQTERTEFIFLMSEDSHHASWRSFMHRFFVANCREFGATLPVPAQPDTHLGAFFRTGLLMDLIHFSDHQRHLPRLARFYLGLYFMSQIAGLSEPDQERVYEAFKLVYPHYRADVTRIQTTTEPREQLEEILFLLSKLDRKA